MLKHLFWFVLFTAASARGEDHRPFSEMHGGCEQFKTPIQKDLSIWAKESVKLSPFPAKANIPLEKKVLLGPLSSSTDSLLVKPEKDFRKGKKSYAGSASLRVPRNGVYRVSLGSKIWLDLVDNGNKNVLEANHFEMQTKCDRIFKVVEYRLERDRDYTLQVSSSLSDVAAILVSPKD